MILVVGGTGRTGRHVVHQLLERGLGVRAIVRPGSSVAPEDARNPNLAVVEADLLSLSDEELQRHVRDCEAVISCLGHVISFKGVFGPPRDLVTRATSRLCRAIEALRPATPVKFILMSSVSVDRAGGLDSHRSLAEKALLYTICALLPPAGDNQRAANVLQNRIGAGSPYVQWAVIRPDSLLPGEVTPYALHEGIVDSLFKPGRTNMANIAHFMCELVTNPGAWAKWSGRLPVIVNAATSAAAATTPP
jgi:uncharacterized protein YbjT (DUF2867 family)